MPESEAVTVVFEPAVETATSWIQNHGTASNNIVTNCSGQYSAGMACWKAADGLIEFASVGPAQQGWDGMTLPQSALE